MILLNPGPVCLSEEVRKALTSPDICHREPEFADLQRRVRSALLGIYELDPQVWTAVLLSGSGTAAVEAMLGTLVARGGKILIVTNGVYGERMCEMAEILRIPFVAPRHGWNDELDADEVARHLASDEQISHVAVVHHETTTGRLNDLAAVAAQCRRRRIGLLVDAVSSFGAEPIGFDAGGITACAASANKCLHGASGAAFVVVRRQALESETPARRSLYLDLANHCRHQDQLSTAFTPPIQILYALDRALAECREQGGRAARRERYLALAGRVRRGLVALGVEPVLSSEESSVVLSAFRVPDRLDYGQLHAHLKGNGFIIYAGQGALGRKVFRISTMGEITMADIDRLLEAFAQVLTPAVS